MSNKNAKDTIGSYPNPNVPNIEKDSGYQLQYAQRAYHDYMNNQYYGYADRAQKIRNKSYRLSEEDTSIYKTKSNVSGDVAYSNLDFTPISVIPAFVDTVVNSILDRGYKVTVSARDSLSQELQEQERNELRGRMYSKEIGDKLSQQFGIDLTDKEAPTSDEEIALTMETEYQDEMEIALEQGIRQIRVMNRSSELDRYVLDDLVTNGEGVVKVELNANGEIEYRYIDDVNFFRSYSTSPDNRKLKHAGHVTTMTMAELRKRVGDEWSEDQWDEVAKMLTENKRGMKTGTAINMNDRRGSQHWYDTVDVDVCEVEWVDFNYANYEFKETDYGFSTVRERGSEYTPPEGAKGREMYTDSYQVVYKCSFVIGTDFIFDSGLAHNISIDQNDFYTANLSYIVYTIYGKPFVEKIIPYAEQIQLIHTSMQKLATRARPNGVAIDVSVLEEAVNNGNGGYFSPLELSEMYDETGNLLYRSVNDDPEMGRSHPPIQQLNTSIRDQLEALITLYNHQAAQIRLVSGVNELRDGSSTHPKTLVAVQEKAIQASNNSTYAIDTAFYDIITRTAERTVEYFQDVMDNSTARDRYEKILGIQTMNVLDRIKDTPIDMLAINIEFEPTIDEKQSLERHIEVALQRQLIELEDAIAIRRLDNIGLAEQMLIQRKKKARERFEEYEAKRMQNESMAEQQKAQMEAQKLQMEGQVKMQTEVGIYQEQAKIDIWKEQQLAQIKAGVANQEIMGKIEVAKITANGGMEKAKYMEGEKNNRDKSQKTMESQLIEQRAGRSPQQDFNPTVEQKVDQTLQNVKPLANPTQNQVV